MNRLEHAIAMNARQHVYDFAVLFLDLDRFKIVNAPPTVKRLTSYGRLRSMTIWSPPPPKN